MTASPHDRRVRFLTLTDPGSALLKDAVPSMLQAQAHAQGQAQAQAQAQARILAPLSKNDRAIFMRMRQVLVDANNAVSCALSDAT